MNRTTNLNLYLASILFWGIACQNNQVTQVIPGGEKVLWVNSYKVDCQGVGPMSCLQTQESDEIEFGDWKNFYSNIEGFDYQPGYLYRLKVNVTQREAPIPADACSLIYSLVEIIEKKPDFSLRITDIWKLIEIEDELVEHDQYSKALVFEMNARDRNFFGYAGCNNLRGQIVDLDERNIKFSSPASTMMACPEMLTESKVVDLLKEVRKYDVADLRLILQDESGKKLLTFMKVD
ncbi:DUF4377 domain-containing protein [Pararhodonellum marinum]|uniref:DUF4377 domain-containing protein n=1 Tax=Pararhodonellum marinum TaxID=2755358 RepID=UPI00188FC064|nr:DUF4377 domain-containing protein [Pararhodonellum marinum]